MFMHRDTSVYLYSYERGGGHISVRLFYIYFFIIHIVGGRADMYEDKDRIVASLRITDMTAARQLCRYISI